MLVCVILTNSILTYLITYCLPEGSYLCGTCDGIRSTSGRSEEQSTTTRDSIRCCWRGLNIIPAASQECSPLVGVRLATSSNVVFRSIWKFFLTPRSQYTAFIPVNLYLCTRAGKNLRF